MALAESASRDYIAEMDAAIEQWTPRGAYVPAVVASTLFRWLRVHDPDLFHGWASAVGPSLLTEVIGRRSRHDRAVALNRRGPSIFAAAARAAEAGNSGPLSALSASYAVDEANTRKPLGDMTQADLEFAASAYEQRAQSNAFEAVFLRVLAERVGDATVADTFTAEQVLALRSNL